MCAVQCRQSAADSSTDVDSEVLDHDALRVANNVVSRASIEDTERAVEVVAR